ncbi:UNVERIFIED_CONTAM: hypothetical protein FKN15_007717 [Acipenser sinensis]
MLSYSVMSLKHPCSLNRAFSKGQYSWYICPPATLCPIKYCCKHGCWHCPSKGTSEGLYILKAEGNILGCTMAMHLYIIVEQEEWFAVYLLRYNNCLVNENFAIDLVAEEPITEVESRVISCDGGGGALGHPRVYINLKSHPALRTSESSVPSQTLSFAEPTVVLILGVDLQQPLDSSRTVQDYKTVSTAPQTVALN